MKVYVKVVEIETRHARGIKRYQKVSIESSLKSPQINEIREEICMQLNRMLRKVEIAHNDDNNDNNEKKQKISDL
jgi:hypothetical protein